MNEGGEVYTLVKNKLETMKKSNISVHRPQTPSCVYVWPGAQWQSFLTLQLEAGGFQVTAIDC